MARPVSDLETHLGYWLRLVSNHVSQGFARKLEGRGVTVVEWVVMRRLYGGDGVAPSHLAERIGMTRGAITKLADRLIDRGMVVRRPDPSDGRAQVLALTARGRTRVPELAGLADDNDAEFFGPLTAREQATLRGLLQRLVEKNRFKNVPID